MSVRDEEIEEYFRRPEPKKLDEKERRQVYRHCDVALRHLTEAASTKHSASHRLRMLERANVQISSAVKMCADVPHEDLPSEPFKPLVNKLSELLPGLSGFADRGYGANEGRRFTEKASQIMLTLSVMVDCTEIPLNGRFAVVKVGAWLDAVLRDEIKTCNARTPVSWFSHVTYADRMKFVMGLPGPLDAVAARCGITRYSR